MPKRDEWRTETCEHCAYRIDSECREAPPVQIPSRGPLYPHVKPVAVGNVEYHGWSKACRRWRHKHECPRCEGDGWVSIHEPVCEKCNGTGRVEPEGPK